MKHHKIFMYGLTFIAAAFLFVHYLVPKPLAADREEFKVTNVFYQGEEITKKLDLKAVAEILSGYSRQRWSNGHSNYSPDTLKIELWVMENESFVNILLGNKLAQYHVSKNNDKTYMIQNADKLIEELENYFNEQ